jgi:hypothetical protein
MVNKGRKHVVVYRKNKKIKTIENIVAIDGIPQISQDDATEYNLQKLKTRHCVCGLCPDVWKSHRFGNWICFCFQVRGGRNLLRWTVDEVNEVSCSNGPIRVSPPPQLKMETDSVSEMLYFLGI